MSSRHIQGSFSSTRPSGATAPNATTAIPTAPLRARKYAPRTSSGTPSAKPKPVVIGDSTMRLRSSSGPRRSFEKRSGYRSVTTTAAYFQLR